MGARKDLTEFGERIHVATNAASLFLLSDATFVFAAMQISGVPMGLPYAIALSVPAAASLFLIMVAGAVPSLIPNAKLETPLVFTLPLAFAALTLTSSLLFSQLGTTSSLTAPSLALGPSLLWRNPAILIGCLIVHVIALAVANRVQHRKGGS